MEIFGLKIDAVPFIELYDFAKETIIQYCIANAKKISSDNKFINDCIPQETELNERVLKWLDTFDGVTKSISFALQYHNKGITKEQIAKFFDDIIKSKDETILKRIKENVTGEQGLDSKKN